jgi:DNA-binding beta-propeller fold protein YncE
MKLRSAVHLSLFLLSSALGGGASAAVLHPHGRTAMPGYTGDFDHFAVDVKGNRLFLAAEDHGTLEVFDLATGAHLRTVTGVDTPHAVLYLGAGNRLLVTDSGAGGTRVFDATSYRRIATIRLAPGADSMAYDAHSGAMYLVTGGRNGSLGQSWLVMLNPRTGIKLAETRFDTDKVEALAVEEKGSRLFVNVTGKNEVGVLDKGSLRVLQTWPMRTGEANAAMAFDEANGRLFVVTRKPYQLLVLDTRDGAVVATLPAPQRTNEAIYDAANRRIYLAGDDFIGIVRQRDADHYEALESAPTAHGAKTAILVPQLKRLFAAVSPGEGKNAAEVLSFDVEPDAPRSAADSGSVQAMPLR